MCFTIAATTINNFIPILFNSVIAFIICGFCNKLRIFRVINCI